MGETVKGYRTGTHRVVPPRETLERLYPLLPTLGITRLANVTGLDRIGIPVVMACRPNSRSLAVSQGKAMDLDAAKASAAMESVEGYHGEHIHRSLKFATYREMRARHKVVDVDLLQRTADSHFHSNLPILWIEGEDWLAREPVWVPYQLVHVAYTREWTFDLRCFRATSTGLAAGNHLLEAASHAISEIVERDACCDWERLEDDAREALRVDLATVDDPLCCEALGRLDRAGVAAAVWEVPSRVGMPVFECLIADRRVDPLHPVCAAGGSGCHPAREVALLRALTEAVQSRLTVIAGSRDDMLRGEYSRWFDADVLHQHSASAARPGVRRFASAPTLAHDTLQSDVACELDRIAAAGLQQVIVVDLTIPELGIPVVRVVVPGAQVPREGRNVAASRRPDREALA
jgi:ribosomal protein S12 methylthiotransferase accessory factor